MDAAHEDGGGGGAAAPRAVVAVGLWYDVLFVSETGESISDSGGV
jgi:hypothetical protein